MDIYNWYNVMQRKIMERDTGKFKTAPEKKDKWKSKTPGLKLKALQKAEIQTLYGLFPVLWDKQDRGKKNKDPVYVQKHAGKEELTMKTSPSGQIPPSFSRLIPAPKKLWSCSALCEEAWCWPWGWDIKHKEARCWERRGADPWHIFSKARVATQAF